jgi:transcriptional regulator with PAS, ATPase and Fis domain
VKGKPEDTLPGAETRPARAKRAADERVDLAVGFRLAVTAGPDAGAVLDGRARALLGTHASCDLVLADPSVSRFHVEITATADGRALIRDLDSTNGTRVDGVAIAAAYLAPGAAITLGDTQLRFATAAEPVSVPVSARARFGAMVGGSPAMARVFALLERAAASDATVLLEGETGTGKEAAAESIHRESKRKDGPFIVVDCGAIPPALLESELFGHERGAFTGAVAAREGAFEAASGGTLFLDEIGELAPDLQPKLLRALERREVKRVGRTKYTPVDVRVVAATNRNLRVEVNAQRFRSDLYYRLAVIDVRLPPLRERAEDLPALVAHLLDGLGADDEARARTTAPASIAELARHAWPGNVRELRNWLERSLALDVALSVQPEHAPDGPESSEPAVDLSRPLKESREVWLRPFERRYVEGLLAREGGNVTAAARAAGVDRITFYRLLWRHGLKR